MIESKNKPTVAETARGEYASRHTLLLRTFMRPSLKHVDAGVQIEEIPTHVGGESIAGTALRIDNQPVVGGPQPEMLVESILESGIKLHHGTFEVTDLKIEKVGAYLCEQFWRKLIVRQKSDRRER